MDAALLAVAAHSAEGTTGALLDADARRIPLFDASVALVIDLGIWSARGRLP